MSDSPVGQFEAWVIDTEAKPPEVVASSQADNEATLEKVIAVMRTTWSEGRFAIARRAA